MESSKKDLSNRVVVDRFIFNNNQSALTSCFTFIPITGVRLPHTGVRFYSVGYTLKILMVEITLHQSR